MSRPAIGWLAADWPAPSRVCAGTTLRTGGVSRPPFESFNLAAHVGDDPQAVNENRARLRRALALPAEPRWLHQVHGCAAVAAGEVEPGTTPADAQFTDRAGEVCAVLTADCLPVLLCDRSGERIAAAHAGWRGLAGGVIEAALARLEAMGARAEWAWLGPAIGPAHFEVGEEVRQRFTDHEARAAEAFRPSPNGRWLADLYCLARQRLLAHGVQGVYGGGRCTYRETEHFYSYRRDGATGRMASLIWLRARE